MLLAVLAGAAVRAARPRQSNPGGTALSSKASPYIPLPMGQPIATPVMTARIMPSHSDAAYHIDAFMCSQVGGDAVPSWHTASGHVQGMGTLHAPSPLEPSISASSCLSGALLNPEAPLFPNAAQAQPLLDPAAILATMGGMQQLQGLHLRHPPVPTHWAPCGDPSTAMSAGLALAAEFPSVMSSAMSSASAVPRMVPMAPAPTLIDLPMNLPTMPSPGSTLVPHTANMSPHLRPTVGVSGVGAPPILAVGPPVMPLSTVPLQSRAMPSMPSTVSHMGERPSMPSAHGQIPERPSMPSAHGQIPERPSKPLMLSQIPERSSMPSMLNQVPERTSTFAIPLSQIPERPSMPSTLNQSPDRPPMHPPLSKIPERPSSSGQSQPLRLVSSLALETPAHDQARRRLKNKPLQAPPGNVRNNSSSLSSQPVADNLLSPSPLLLESVPRRLPQRLDPKELTLPPSRAAPELPNSEQPSPGGASASDMLFQ